MQRIVASLLVLAVVATSGAVGGTAYLCLMDGRVRADCCCKKAQADARDCAKLERADACCDVLATEIDHAPARFETSKKQLVSAPMVALLEPNARPMPPVRIVSPDKTARGPPLANGPPLFIQNCSYLS